MSDSSSIKRDLYDCLDTLKQHSDGMVDPYAVARQYGLIAEGEGKVQPELRARLQKAWDTEHSAFLDGYHSKEEWALADQAFHDYCDVLFLIEAMRDHVKERIEGVNGYVRQSPHEPDMVRLGARIERLMTSLVTRGIVEKAQEYDLPCGVNDSETVQFVGKIIRHTLDVYNGFGTTLPTISPTKDPTVSSDLMARLIRQKPNDYSQMILDAINEPDPPKGRA